MEIVPVTVPQPQKPSTDQKQFPWTQEKKVALAEVELHIETEVLQVNLEHKTLTIPRLGLTYTLNTTDQFPIQTAKGTISSSLLEMPQTQCQQHKNLGQVSLIKH